MTKICSRCKKEFDKSCFYKNHSTCKSCSTKTAGEYRKRLKLKGIKPKRNSITDFNGHLRRKYNITLSDYNRMIEDQNNKCKICGSSFNQDNKIHVDHNHDTGKVRGLLCKCCNFGLGMFSDSEEKLMCALKYLIEK